jgi:NAD+ diphosphatase
LPHVIPAFAGGGLHRNAARRRSVDLITAVANGAKVLGIWAGQVPLKDAGGLALCDLIFGSGGVAEMIYLGEVEGFGEIFAQDLGEVEPAPPLPKGAAWSDLRQAMLLMSPAEAEMAATAKALLSWHKSHQFCSTCGQKSKMAEAGWLRKCPSCQAMHFPRTDPVVIMLITKGDLMLLGRNAAWPEGMYSTLAGFMEPGETVEAAVRREVAEETGVVVGHVRYVSSQPWPFPASLMLGCHGLAETESITLDPEELEDALWVSRSEMVSVLAGSHPKIKPMRRGAIAHALVVNWLADREN